MSRRCALRVPSARGTLRLIFMPRTRPLLRMDELKMQLDNQRDELLKLIERLPAIQDQIHTLLSATEVIPPVTFSTILKNDDPKGPGPKGPHIRTTHGTR